MDAIERDIIAIDWSLATGNIDIDLSFITYLRLFYRVFKKLALLKKTTKPWVTKGTIKSKKLETNYARNLLNQNYPKNVNANTLLLKTAATKQLAF